MSVQEQYDLRATGSVDATTVMLLAPALGNYFGKMTAETGSCGAAPEVRGHQERPTL